MIFERFLPTFKAKEPEHRLWSSATYFSLIDQLDQDHLNQSLTWDLISFLHEYVGMKDKKIYPYGPYGIMNAYYQTTSQLCLKQETALIEKGLDPTRAQLETRAALRVETWMADPKVAIGQKLMIISPRGTPEEGYPGLEKKHYVFVNFYEKISETDFQLVQYTSYAPEVELEKLQNTVADLGGATYQPEIDTPSTVSGPIKLKSLSHQIIDRPLLLPSSVTFTQLEPFIYQNEKKWVTTRNHLPQVPEEAFSQEVARVIELLLTQFWLLVETAPVVAALNFDELVKVVREHFLKWMEHHALNYHPDTNLAPFALNLDQILESWQLSLKQKNQTLNQEEEEKLSQIKKAIALDPLQPLLRASSVAHCIVGTPGSLAAQALRLNPNLLMLGSSEFQALSSADKKGLLEKIKAEQMVEITLSGGPSGKSEVWMVPRSFLEGKGCWLSDEGIAMGPCDVPLSESFAFKMTLSEFNQFVSELERQAFESEFDQVEQELVQKLGLDDDQSRDLTTKIKRIKSLIFKPVVSITELLSGDIVKSFHQHQELSQIISQLRTSSNPLVVSDQIIKKLLEAENGVLGLGEV